MHRSLDPKSAVAVTWHDPKQAAIYYDKILPCADYHSVPEELRLDYELLRESYRQLADEYEKSGDEWKDFVESIHDPAVGYDAETLWVANDYVVAAAAALASSGIDCSAFCDESDQAYERLLVPEYYDDRIARHRYDGAMFGKDEPSTLPSLTFDDNVEIQLIGLEVIDTRKADWGQIRELKRDAVANRLLKEMRLLVDDKLRDKSPAYVENYIGVKLDAFEAKRKEHGFETATTTVQAIINSRSVLGLAAIAAATMASENTPATLIVAGVTAALETANIGLQLVNRRRKLVSMSHEGELAYIRYANSRLQKTNGKGRTS